jgi:hypothetical protein
MNKFSVFISILTFIVSSTAYSIQKEHDLKRT